MGLGLVIGLGMVIGLGLVGRSCSGWERLFWERRSSDRHLFFIFSSSSSHPSSLSQPSRGQVTFRLRKVPVPCLLFSFFSSSSNPPYCRTVLTVIRLFKSNTQDHDHVTPDETRCVRGSSKGDVGPQADPPSGRKGTKEVQSRWKSTTCPCIQMERTKKAA